MRIGSLYNTPNTNQQTSTLTLLADKRQTPRENVHEVGQPVGVRAAVELSDVHDVVLVL